jgi:excisionase family DNA binding protein
MGEAEILEGGDMRVTEDKYLTVAELSEYLQIHRTTIYRMLREGRLPGFRIGSDWRFSLEAIKEWARDQMKTGAARYPDALSNSN